MNILKIGLLILLGLLSSCGNGTKETALLQKASGKPGEMIVVMDSTQWNQPLGEAIRNTFQAEMVGLPRQEVMFKVNQVDPVAFNSVLKTVKNLLFVVTLDNYSPGSKVLKSYFTKNSLDQINENEDLFVYTAVDEFARGQNIMYLFSKDSETLTAKIIENQKKLQDHFNTVEKERLKSGLYKAKEKEGFSALVQKEHSFDIKIPFGYKMVYNKPGFVWFRQINDESDKDIFITYKPYISESIFNEDKIISFRDSIAKKELFEDPDREDSYIVTETNVPYIPVVSREYNFNNKFAKETRGIWKTNNLSMGGPFIGYTVVDEDLGRHYYIEGFVYSPGKSQREFVRELEVILNTFKVSSEIQKP